MSGRGIRRILLLAAALLLVNPTLGCDRGGDSSESGAGGGENAGGGEENANAGGGEENAGGGENANAGGGTAENTPEQPAQPEQGTGFEGVRGDRFESERFNVRFLVPNGWRHTPTPEADSATLVGPDDLQVVVATSESVQLADTNFTQLNDRVSFEQVNVMPDRTQTRPVNGFPTYRVEGDALLRGDGVPIYFVSQVVTLPGDPVMITIYVPGDYYDLHSDEMRAVLDSVEAVNIRPQ